MTLTKLFTHSDRWYVTLRDGYLTIGATSGAPTTFSTNMSREDVIAAMKRKTPDLEIDLEQTETGRCPVLASGLDCPA